MWKIAASMEAGFSSILSMEMTCDPSRPLAWLSIVIGVVVSFHFLLDVWWELLIGGVLASATALALARLLAKGMTTPLRDMAHAANQMSHGDYSRRVHAGRATTCASIASNQRCMPPCSALYSTGCQCARCGACCSDSPSATKQVWRRLR